MTKRIFNEGVSSEQTAAPAEVEHALGSDPFDSKRLRLLRALSDAIFCEPPTDPTARRQSEELVATFAQLFFPGLPAEQARRDLALTVTNLLEAAAEEERLAQPTASTNGLPPGLHLTPSDETLIHDVMSQHGLTREKAIDLLIAFGGI